MNISFKHQRCASSFYSAVQHTSNIKINCAISSWNTKSNLFMHFQRVRDLINNRNVRCKFRIELCIGQDKKYFSDTLLFNGTLKAMESSVQVIS